MLFYIQFLILFILLFPVINSLNNKFSLFNRQFDLLVRFFTKFTLKSDHPLLEYFEEFDSDTPKLAKMAEKATKACYQEYKKKIYMKD